MQDQVDAAVFFYQPAPNSVRKSCDILKPGGKLIFIGEGNGEHFMIPSGKRISYQGLTYTDILDPPCRLRELWYTAIALLKKSDAFGKLLQVKQREKNVFDVYNKPQTKKITKLDDENVSLGNESLLGDSASRTLFSSYS